MILSKTKFIISVMIFVTAAPSLALAQSSNTLSGLFACENITDKNTQLNCFLDETAKLRGVETSVEKNALDNVAPLSIQKDVMPKQPTVLREAEAPVVKEAPVEKAVVEDEPFIPVQKDTTPKKRTLTIASTTTFGRNDYVRFTMANGEVWQQSSYGKVRLGRGNPDKLTIKKAYFNSFLARVNDKGTGIRVKRVK